MTRSKNNKRLGAASIAFALFASACSGTPTEETSAAGTAPAAAVDEAVDAPSAGGPGLPILVGDTVAGAQLDTNDLQGQDTVVWFWAPW